MHERIFITGATGLLGGAILHQALSHNSRRVWRALVRGADEAEARARLAAQLARFAGVSEAARLAARVEVVPGGLENLDTHGPEAFAGVTRIVHLAADTSFTSGASSWDVNFDGTLRLAAIAVRLPRLERFLHVGTATICGAAPPQIVREDDYPRAGVEHLVEYTKAKAAAEFVLRERYPRLPLVVARPSIVTGHTVLGARPSSSIFWFVRFADSVNLAPGSETCHMDIVPSDWTAQALIELLFKPELSWRTYHVSAGEASRSSWRGLADAFDALRGDAGPKRLFEVFAPERLDVLKARVAGHPEYQGRMGKLILRAAQRYYRFCQLDVTFDNSRLLAEGIPAPPSLASYLDVCLANPPGQSIMDAFMDDAEMFLDVVDGGSRSPASHGENLRKARRGPRLAAV